MPKKLPEYTFRVTKPHEEKERRPFTGISKKDAATSFLEAVILQASSILPMIPAVLAAHEAENLGFHSEAVKMTALGVAVGFSFLLPRTLGAAKMVTEISIKEKKHVIAEKEGKRVGRVGIYLTRRRNGKRVVRAHDLYVNSGHRKKGVATRLVYNGAKHVEKMAREDPETEYYFKGFLVRHGGASKLLDLARKGIVPFKPVKIKVGSKEWKTLMKQLKKKAASYSSTS